VCAPCCTGRGANGCPWTSAAPLPAEPQVNGDPVRGRDLLLNGAYMTCGIPFKLWANPAFRATIAGGFGGPATAATIPDRTGHNAELPYFLNAFESPDGAEVVNANCLMCHGGSIDGKLVLGLGNATADFTRGAGGGSTGIPLTDDVLDLLGLDAKEKAQLRKIFGRGAALGPQTTMATIGMNPAEMFAVILMVHHDRDTLAWSDTPLTPLVILDRAGQPIPDARVTSDPPPWWRVRKKNALFYNGMARGDHRGTMALATSVCVDDVARAQQVDEWFKDIQAFVKTVTPPPYPRKINPGLADRGQRVFLKNCAGCHGTYGPREQDDTYPNLLVPLPVIGTDPVVAEAGVVHAPELVAWYNQSFYGQVTRMEPNDPFPGYMPPPLDGIWATAPYLHNGSVPTIELVLNSRARPTYWKRVDLDSSNWDENALGWPFTVVATPAANAPPADRPLIFDTTAFSQSNAGHVFGDHLTPAERRAVIEYLKTL
jgi:Cytochrome c